MAFTEYRNEYKIGEWHWLLYQYDRMSNPISLASAGRVFSECGRIEVLPPPTLPLSLITWQEADGLLVTEDFQEPVFGKVAPEYLVSLTAGLRRVCEAFCYKAFGLAVSIEPGFDGLTIVDSFGVDAPFIDSVPGYHFEDTALTLACVNHLKDLSPQPELLRPLERRYVGQWDDGIIESLAAEYGSVLIRSYRAEQYAGTNRLAHIVKGRK